MEYTGIEEAAATALNRAATQQKRDQFISFRVTRDQFKILGEVAAGLGIDRSTFVRNAANDVAAEIKYLAEAGEDEREETRP